MHPPPGQVLGHILPLARLTPWKCGLSSAERYRVADANIAAGQYFTAHATAPLRGQRRLQAGMGLFHQPARIRFHFDLEDDVTDGDPPTRLLWDGHARDKQVRPACRPR